jgi:hypothetical protein
MVQYQLVHIASWCEDGESSSLYICTNPLGNTPPLGFKVLGSLLSSLTPVLLPFIIVRFCSWWAYICQSVLLTLASLSSLSRSCGPMVFACEVVAGCPMHVASVVSACPSMHLQQNQPVVSCVFLNLASHRHPTSVTYSKNRYSRWVQCPTAKAMVLVHCFISISNLYLACTVCWSCSKFTARYRPDFWRSEAKARRRRLGTV